MKKFITALICVFIAVCGYVFISLVKAGTTLQPESISMRNMGISATTAKLYAVKLKETTGTGSFPAGNSTEICKTLVSFGLQSVSSDIAVTNQNGTIIDAYGVPIHFSSSSEKMTITSLGEDKTLNTPDDLVINITIPGSAR